jgi:exonuclease VII small subunit
MGFGGSEWNMGSAGERLDDSGKNSAKPNINRDLETLIAETERNRIQLQESWKKFENLEAAIEAAKTVLKKAKALDEKPGESAA